MQSTYQKQVAYNQRIMKAEEEISGINCDIADFVSQMSLDPADELIICVNGTHELGKGERAMAGQLWIQGDKMMTAANPAFPGMSNTSESAVLSAAAEALEWRNDALELPNPPRKGQRVVIYPKGLWSLEEVLATGSTDGLEEGHDIACQRILAAANQFELTPTFLKEDSEVILSDPKKAELVPQWMCMAEQVAIGGRSRVLQDGPDTPNSDDEAKEDVEADKLTDMYAPGMKPCIANAKISPEVAAQQRALYAAQRASASFSSSQTVSSDFGNSIVNSPQSSRPLSPPTYEAEDDGSWMTPAQRAKAEMAAKAMAARHEALLSNSQRCTEIPRCSSAPGEKPPKSSQPAQSHPASVPKDGAPASRSRADAGPSHQSAEATHQAPANRTESGQVGPRTKESTHKRAELDACDLGEAQGAARTCVLHVATPRET
jgi:hypothetical protein